MSQFYEYFFEFDGIPSHKFDLKIITFEDGSLFDGVGSSDVEIITQSVLRKSKPYYLGRTQTTVLEFELTFGRAEPVSGIDRDMISAWLFGRAGYKRLTILQDDLNGAYFNCFLKNPVPLYIGGLNYAFKCTVVCDSPWAYGPEKTISGSTVDADVYPLAIEIYNNSSEDEYLYPWIQFIMGEPTYPFPTSIFVMWNETDDAARWFSISHLEEGDAVIVDNDLQIITWNGVGNILPYFDKRWLRLLPGYNLLYLNTNVSLYIIKYTERFKIGG
jgi:hypothetical protein